MTENDAICSMLSGDNPLAWPSIINQPINEFRTPGLATQAFPTLFPYGTGDPTCPGRQHKVTLTEAFKHLIMVSLEVCNSSTLSLLGIKYEASTSIIISVICIIMLVTIQKMVT